MFGLSRDELRILRPLTTPRKIQDFLDGIAMNFEDTCFSPRTVLKKRRAHCLEGAMLAATALRLHGHPPILLDLTSSHGDDDHVVALFRDGKFWGAISHTNHAVLRYREPVYRSVRELAISFFHEYFLDDGRKTLRSYSVPFDLSRFDSRGWMTSDEDIWYVHDALFEIRHFRLLTRSQLLRLRRADPIEREAGKLVRWKRR
jgi:hypothetical protein